MSKFQNLSAGERFVQRAAHMGEEMVSAVGGALFDEATRAGVDYIKGSFCGTGFDLEAAVPAVARKVGGVTLSSDAKTAHMSVLAKSLFLFKFDDTVSVVVPTAFRFRRGCLPDGLSNELLTRGLLYGEWKYSPCDGLLRLECHANLPTANLTADTIATVGKSLIQAVNGLEAEVARRHS